MPNDYQRLENLGWIKKSGNSRYDFYVKKNWIAIVPSTIDRPIRFIRNTKNVKSN